VNKPPVNTQMLYGLHHQSNQEAIRSIHYIIIG